MDMPLINTLRRLDRHWLLNHPILWVMRLHWMIYFWLIGLALICLLALVLPVHLHSIHSFDVYFLSTLTWAGLAVSPWIFLQARFAPQLRQNSRARSAVHLLAGYILIFSSHLAWPYAFTRILEARIAGKAGEDEVRNDINTLADINYRLAEELSVLNQEVLPSDLQDEFRALYKKYLGREPEFMPGQRFDPDLVTVEIAVHEIAFIKKITDVYGTGLIHHNATMRFALFSLAILLSLLLRIYHLADVRTILSSLLFAVSVPFLLAIAATLLPAEDVILFYAAFLFVFAVAVCAALLILRQKRKSTLLAVGLTAFTLLLAWMPLSISQICCELGYFEYTHDEGLLFHLGAGVVMLLVSAPWIQRRYLAHQSKPS